MAHITFLQQAEAVELAEQNVLDEHGRVALKEAAATLRDLHEGKFVSDGQFRVPEPTWDDITKPCPRCGMGFKWIACAGGGGGR